jgi:Kef-type K+ transport system membrane component KefB
MTEFLELVLVLIAIILGAKLAGFAVSKLGQPMVVGEIAFGLLLGPSALNFLGISIFTHADTTKEVIHLLAELGVLLLMFLAGLETDLVAMRKVGVPALNSAIGGVVIPFLGGWGLSSLAGLPLGESVFIGTILTATSVSISAQTLIEMNRLRSKEGMTILGAAVIDDVIGILMLSVVVAVFATGGGAEGAAEAVSSAPTPVWLVAVKMIAFFAVGVLLAPLVRRFTSGFGKLPISEPLLAAGVIVALVYGFGAEMLGGVAAITGSYLAGVILGGIHEKHELEEKAKALVYSVFVPIFFVDIGLRANVIEAFSGPLWLFGIGIVIVALIGKVVGSGLGAYVSKFSFQESLRVGTGMISRGEVGLIVAGIGLQRGVITQSIFSIIVLMVIASTLVTPILLRLTFANSKDETPAIDSR